MIDAEQGCNPDKCAENRFQQSLHPLSALIIKIWGKDTPDQDSEGDSNDNTNHHLYDQSALGNRVSVRIREPNCNSIETSSDRSGIDA